MVVDCKLCGSAFKENKNLYVHMRRHHRCEESDIEELKAKLKMERKGCEPTMPCRHCERTFYSETSRIRHEIEEHREKLSPKLPCTQCATMSRSREELALHYSQLHPDSGNFELHTKELSSEADFTALKTNVEKEAGVAYRVNGTRIGADHTTTYYVCSRETGSRGGKYTDKKDKQRMRKSKKDTTYCTAFLTKNVFHDGRIVARYCCQHSGHQASVALLPLSNEDKLVIAGLVESGLTNAMVARNLSRRYSNCRLHHVTTADVANVRARFGLHPGRRHTSDHSSNDQLSGELTGNGGSEIDSDEEQQLKEEEEEEVVDVTSHVDFVDDAQDVPNIVQQVEQDDDWKHTVSEAQKWALVLYHLAPRMKSSRKELEELLARMKKLCRKYTGVQLDGVVSDP